jgi:gliding motility-associated-like protein
VKSMASSDVVSTKYFLNDGSTFGTPDFSHIIKNLNKTNPLLVQIVKNLNGCADTVLEVLKIRPAFVVYFPNVFTPNGDGTNDTFMPKGVGIIKFSMQIYDRWGHEVFRTNDITVCWDGQHWRGGDDSVKQDVYTWKAQVTDVFSKPHTYVGHVTLIR